MKSVFAGKKQQITAMYNAIMQHKHAQITIVLV